MNTQRSELYIGTMVLAALAVFVLLTIQFSKNTLFDFSGTYKVAVHFEAAPGVALNAPVYKNGVKIGSVASVKLIDDDRAVEVVLMIQRGRKIYTNEDCKLTQSMIMNDSKIEFVRSHKATNGEVREIPNDGTAIINGVVPSDLFSSFSNIEGELETAIVNVSGAASGLAEFMSRLSMFVGTHEEIEEKQAQLGSLINKAEETMDNINTAAQYAKEIIADPVVKNGICDGIKQFPEVMKTTQEILVKGNNLADQAQQIATDIQGTAGKVDTIIGKVEPVVDNLATDIPKVSETIQRGMGKFESITSDIASITNAVASGDGPIRQFLSDETLYENVQQVVYNAREITDEIKPVLRGAKPVMDNAQVLTDKLARDPSVIISGLFRKQAPLKGGMPQWGDGLGSDGLTDYDMGMIRGNCSADTFPIPAGRNTREYPAPRKFGFSLWPFGKKTEQVVSYDAGAPYTEEMYYSEDAFETMPHALPQGMPADLPMQLPTDLPENMPLGETLELEFPESPTPQQTPRIMPVPDLSGKSSQGRIVVTDPRSRRRAPNTAMPTVDVPVVTPSGSEPQLVFTPEKSVLR